MKIQNKKQSQHRKTSKYETKETQETDLMAITVGTPFAASFAGQDRPGSGRRGSQDPPTPAHGARKSAEVGGAYPVCLPGLLSGLVL